MTNSEHRATKVLRDLHTWFRYVVGMDHYLETSKKKKKRASFIDPILEVRKFNAQTIRT